MSNKMNKSEFIDKVKLAGLKFKVVSVRVNKDRNYGLEQQYFSLWLTGSNSCDESLTMSVDCMPLLLRFKSLEKAINEKDKYNRWLNSINC